jgi:outer membrane protein assembly factor BamB
VLTGHAQTRTSGEELSVFPASLTMGARGQRTVSVATRSGKVPARVEWSVSNPSIASITSRGSFVDVRPLSPGRALVTARVAGRTVSASVTVAEENDLRFGTTRWAVPAVAGLVPRAPLDASNADGNAADLFAIDADPMKRFAVVRALKANGTLVWQSTVRGTPWAGDQFGGLLVRLGAIDQPSRTLARLDRPRSAVAAWRYRARGDIDDFGQADDGTIYLTVQTHPRLTAARDESSQVVALDGRTGLEAGHFTLPASTWQTMGSCTPKAASVRRPSELGSLGEGAGGGIYVQMLIAHDTWTRTCERGRPVPGRGRFKISRELQLLRLTRKGFTIVRTLWRSDVEGPDTVERLRAVEDVAPGPIVELKSGELVAMRTHLNLDAGGRLSGRLTITRLARGEVVREVVRPAVARGNKPWRVLIDAPDTARLYFGDGTTLQATDLDTGTVLWSMDSAAVPFEAVETNTVIANDPVRGQVVEINFRGTVLRTFGARVDDPRTVAGGVAVFHGVDPQTRAIVEVQQPPYVETGWSTVIDIGTSFDEVRRRYADFLLETR